MSGLSAEQTLVVCAAKVRYGMHGLLRPFNSHRWDMKDFLIVVLFGLLVWTLITLADVENQRYALSIGLCPNSSAGKEYLECINSVETRTNPIWHVVYALGML